MSARNPSRSSSKTATTPSLAGLDLGAVSTRVRLAHRRAENGARVAGMTLPTVLGYSRDDARAGSRPLVGTRALECLEDVALVSPFDCDGPRRSRALSDFARALRDKLAPAWGVVPKYPGRDAEGVLQLRAAVNEVFERFLIVDASLLATREILDGRRNHCAILVDLGATSTRAFLVSGTAPLENEHAVIAGGGNAVDALLRQALVARFPDLELTGETVRAIKESLATLSPEARRAEIALELGGSTRRIDVTESLRIACEHMPRDAAAAVEGVLSSCPSDYVERFLGNIILFGGGALLEGIEERVQGMLRATGIDRARVRIATSPASVLATGALKWARDHRAKDDWATPLFSYAM